MPKRKAPARKGAKGKPKPKTKTKAKTAEAPKPIRLNLGCGKHVLPDYVNIDKDVCPLPYESGSVDEIRASHLIEHFDPRRALVVLDEWMRVLKPGGVLKLAVPDMDWITEHWAEFASEPVKGPLIRGYILGRDVDGGPHRSLHNVDSLEALMEAVGLKNITAWTSELADCASLPVTLNRQGIKRHDWQQPLMRPGRKITALMSIPRIIFADNLFCAMEAFVPLGIKLQRRTGVYWSHSLTAGMEAAIEEGVEYIITLDYDTTFTVDDVAKLIRLMDLHPDADAINGVQLKRDSEANMLTIRDENWNLVETHTGMFQDELTKLSTAHFGLTIFRAERLKDLPRPWFNQEPNAEGNWGEGCIPPDIYFWRLWEREGRTLYQANDVRLGHIELMVKHSLCSFRPGYQTVNDYNHNGKPKEAHR